MSALFPSRWRLCRCQGVLKNSPALSFVFPHGRAVSQRTQVEPARPLAFDLHEPTTSKASGENQAPIIFLHGLFGSKKNNRGISKALARDLGAPVYALDLRNHGESPHNQRHDYRAMARDVSTFIQDHSLRNVTVIGHSMGAKTAMVLALCWPEMVASLVSVDNAPVNAALNQDFAKYIRGMNKVQAANVTRQAEADRILQEFEPSLPIRQFLLGNLYRSRGEDAQRFRVPLDILARSLGDLGDFPYSNPSERSFEKPALFVRGTRSHYVTDAMLPTIKSFFPQFRLADIDAGHWLISEQPEAFRKGEVITCGAFAMHWLTVSQSS
ncbi:alpha/beta hydrolase fold domain-containing protein [Hirsutella rhossiliensis]|uniref:Alpha/beta hydrolase fold domain-containing protein n=1 Tax=Hirsutella rhossiliensis TaxID=111463 RepID=A0A9P8N063_9HYPO|nr:alpha/beta hydrolase fold domain-containing protein [Hirsutella rhossiliensis]KAH0964440.1 alpha/beta hydrolase fold domain-containing protein [Hirsutella rhossiliensis]